MSDAMETKLAWMPGFNHHPQKQQKESDYHTTPAGFEPAPFNYTARSSPGFSREAMTPT